MFRRFCFACLFFTVAATLSVAADAEYAVTPYEDFPTPAPGAYLITGTALADGRLLLWNGGQVYLETAVKSGEFNVIAQGYTGDPGFAALAPDGITVLLGAGYFGDLYLFDTAHPADFSPETIVATLSHYAGVFLSAELVLLDVTKADFSGSELVILDISGAKAAPVTVVTKPPLTPEAKDIIINKPPWSYAAGLAVDAATGFVYAMDGSTRELRAFSVSALLDAYATSGTLDWTNDGTLIGQPGMYYTGGVGGIAPDGRLIIGGSEGYLLPGGIQLVDPATGMITQVLDPAQNQGFYAVVYNAATGVITAIVGGQAFAVDLLDFQEGEFPDDSSCRLQTFYETGDTLCLTLPAAIDPAASLQWRKDGTPLLNGLRITGAHDHRLLITALTLDDAGDYTCTYDDGSKAFIEYDAGHVYVTEQVPATGCVGLVFIAGTCSLASLRALRRHIKPAGY